MTWTVMLLLKSLLVFALAGLALLFLRRASASARHLVCLLTLASLLVLPLFSLTLPVWHVAGLSSTDQLPPPVSLITSETDPPAPNNGGAGTTQAELAPVLSENSAARSAPLLLGAGGHPSPLPLLLLTLYVLGVLLAGLRPLLGLWGIAHLRRACTPIIAAPTLSVSADCSAALRLTRQPQLCRADVPVPLTWGWLRPVVVLPLAFADWPEDRLRSVLLHEMAHVKRRDWPCHRLADLACALYWFHPLVWLTSRRLRAESEAACDDLVLSSGVAAPDYARHLLEIAGALSRPLPGQSAIAMAQTPHIKRRILMILDTAHSRRTVTRRALLIALIPSAAALVMLATLRPDAKAQAVADATNVAGIPVTAPNGSVPLNLQFSGTRFLQVNHDAGPGQISFTTSPDLKINGTTLLAGISDASKPSSQWWSATGTLLPTPVYTTPFADGLVDAELDGTGDAQNVAFAFRLPPSAQGVTIKYRLPQSHADSSQGTWPGKSASDAGRTESQMFASTGGARVVTAAFPATLKKTSVQVGIASGAWKTVIIEPKTPGAVEPFGGLSTAVGGSLFILGVPDQTTKGLLLPVATNMADNINDIRIVAVGNQGQTLFPTTIGDESSGSGASSLDQIKAYFSQPVSQIKEFRVETRPFQWIEFRDVALQPKQ